jgi:hypothetical protein
MTTIVRFDQIADIERSIKGSIWLAAYASTP